MATQTTHYNLTKPEMSDTVGADIPALAANFEMIDTVMYQTAQGIGDIEAVLASVVTV